LDETNKDCLEEEVKLVSLSKFESLLVLLHHSKENACIDGVVDFHIFLKFNAFFHINLHSLSNLLLLIKNIDAFLQDCLHDAVDVSSYFVLAVIFVTSELLVEHKVLSPFQ